MSSFSRYLPFVAAMALVVVASNILVQFPMQGQIGGLSLADVLTWGAFTYPSPSWSPTLPTGATDLPWRAASSLSAS